MFERVLAAVVIVACTVPLLPALRRRAVMREATKVARAAHPAEPGSDWPALYGRLASRDLGAKVGVLAAGVVMVIVFLTMELPEPLLMMGFVVMSTGRSLGALAGHLLGVRRSVPVARVASLQQRELRHYLLPLEARLSQAVLVVPLAGVALGGTWWFIEPGASTARAVVGASAICLGLVLASAPLAMRTLRTSTRVTTDGGLLWGELLRAILLRDAYAGMRGLAATGAALGLLMALGVGSTPRWFTMGAVATMVVAMLLTAALGLVSSADSMHAWARGHVVPEVV